jgi:hypothetical protein
MPGRLWLKSASPHATPVQTASSISCKEGYCANQRAACAVSVFGVLKQRRAASISASLAPWLRAHISAVDAEYFAT